ncbi:unnamed protein product [Caenorhabditis brenneri]
MHSFSILFVLSSLVIYSNSSCEVATEKPASTETPGTTEEACPSCTKIPDAVPLEFINETFISTVPNSFLPYNITTFEDGCLFNAWCGLSYPENATIEYEFFFLTQSGANPEDTNIVMGNDVVLECPFGSDTWYNGEDKIMAMGCYGIYV